MKKSLLSLIFFLLIVSPAWGATYYVGKASGTMYRNTTGCPVTTGDTASTIQQAVTASGSGGIVNICSGTYTGTDIRNPVATLGAGATNQTIQSATGIKTDVILDGTGLGDNIITVGVGQTGFSLSNITLQNSDTGKYGMLATEAPTVTNVDILNCSRGMYLQSNAGGTYTKVKINGCKDANYVLAISGTVNPIIFNYSIFSNSLGYIAFINAATITFNNCAFLGAKDLAILNGSGKATTATFNNSIFAFNGMAGANAYVIQTSGAGTWTFNNSLLGGTAVFPANFLYNTGGTATVIYNSCVVSQDPKFVATRGIGKTFFFIDDTPNLNDWYTLADTANITYTYPVSFGMYVIGTESYSAADWEKLAGYITGGVTGNNSGIVNELASHGQSGVRLYTEANDDASGKVNAFTWTDVGTTLTIAATRTDPAVSSGWTGTITLSGAKTGEIALENASYDTVNEVITWLVTTKGGVVGSATGQIPYNHPTMMAKSICLKAGVYASGATILFDQTSLFVVEMKESKIYLESKITPYIGGWTVKSFLWSGGNHGANGNAYVINTAGYSQARSVTTMNTADYNVTALGLYRVGAADPLVNFGTTDPALTNNSSNYFASLAQQVAVGGIFAHSFSTFSLANWISVFNALRSVPGVSALTFNDTMDWVRATDDHVTSNISYRCSTGTASCLIDISDFHIQPGGPGIDKGVNVGLTVDYEGKLMRGLPDIGTYEFQGIKRKFISTHGFINRNYKGPLQ